MHAVNNWIWSLVVTITTHSARSNLNINIILKLLSQIFFSFLCVHVHVYVCHAYATTFWSQKMSEPLKLELQVIRSHLGSSEGAVQTPNHQIISPVLNIRCKRIPGHLKLSFRFILYVMGVLPTCLCVPHACLGPGEVRRGCWIPGSYKVLGIKLRSFGRATSVLDH